MYQGMLCHHNGISIFKMCEIKQTDSANYQKRRDEFVGQNHAQELKRHIPVFRPATGRLSRPGLLGRPPGKVTSVTRPGPQAGWQPTAGCLRPKRGRARGSRG